MNAVKGLCLLVVTTSLMGCRAPRVNLIDSGVLALELHSTDHVRVRWVRAYQEASGVTITGLLEHQDSDSATIRVHVDVALLSSTDEILAEAVSVPVFLPTERTAHATRGKPFRVTLDVDLPDQARLQVKVHYSEHDEVSE